MAPTQILQWSLLHLESFAESTKSNTLSSRSCIQSRDRFTSAVAGPLFLQLVHVGRLFLAAKEQPESSNMENPFPYWTLIRDFGALDLVAFVVEVHIMRMRQEATRVPHVPKGRIQKHEAGLENVEIDLVAQYRTQLS